MVHKDLLYDVITHTITIDNVIAEIIRKSFGLNVIWEDSPDPYKMEMINKKEIERFDTFFIQDLGSSSKLKLVKDIIKEDYVNKIELPIDFDKKIIRFYKIRNIYAHSLYPKHIDKKEMPNLLPNNATWEELHKEHSEIFNEINAFLVKEVYLRLRIEEVELPD